MHMHTILGVTRFGFFLSGKKEKKKIYRDNGRQVFSLGLSWGWIARNFLFPFVFCLRSPHSPVFHVGWYVRM